jgi:superfamily I DNA/RNA helicase
MIAQFPNSLDLPNATLTHLANAATAVKKEYRSSVRWKKLRCRSVVPLSASVGETIFVLEVGQLVEFDWTWEGATAFRPPQMNEFQGDVDFGNFLTTSDENNAAPNPSLIWCGEVIEVDETNGRIFVSSDPTHPPKSGSFFVRPFEFLAFLNSVYSECHDLSILLSERLQACKGGIHPRISDDVQQSSPDLKRLWQHSWGILWGPPGSGKTFRIGQQIARCFNDPTERILVVSTTNRATDEVAISIGKATKELSPASIGEGLIRRIGKSADFRAFEKQELGFLLEGTETELLVQIGELNQKLAKAESHEEKAAFRQQIQALRRQTKDNAFGIFLSSEVKVVVSTAFKAITLLNHPDILAMIEQGTAPFTTVIVDEAGLISRAATAVLSLLGSRRVLIVGDSKQLAPISKISRILLPDEKEWLASSAVSHLQTLEQSDSFGVHLLHEQHRMHPHVNQVVSAYQYENKLVTAKSVHARRYSMPTFLERHPRSLWYVLDEDAYAVKEERKHFPSIRAERGSGNRSWVRPITRTILEKFFSDAQTRKTKGLFLSPFKAQARDITSFFAKEGIESWSAATIHSQQGTEADFVIFDTVNAGSFAWPYDEWKRLINVGLSRAKEFVMLLASRSEMQEPYLQPLIEDMEPGILVKEGRTLSWKSVPIETPEIFPEEITKNPERLGYQIRKRKELRPVLSHEQQRLCGLKLDGKPRLVRGVAGSGKTYVLVNWLTKMLKAAPTAKYSVVYANNSLLGLIKQMIQDSWEDKGTKFPWEKVDFCHISKLLEMLLSQVGLKFDGYEYDAAAEAYLSRRSPDSIPASCDAMFIDEGQDMGANTLRLLSALVRRSDPTDPKSRSINIFYDNAQNIFGRSTPKWADMELDMRGRSTIMKESFRATKPISEFALNVLYRLEPPKPHDEDHKELVKLGLIEHSNSKGSDWWHVRFNQIDGPVPEYHPHPNLESEFTAIGDRIVSLIQVDGVSPKDICILYVGKNISGKWLPEIVKPKLNAIGFDLLVQQRETFIKDDRIVIATTPHSFKGYDAEVVIIAGADQFNVNSQKVVLASTLYVAMTRSRSILAIYGSTKSKDGPPTRIHAVIEECLDQLVDRPIVDMEISKNNDLEEVFARLKCKREWLEKKWKDHHPIEQEPLQAPNGEIIGEPLFWYRAEGRIHACFEPEKLSKRRQHQLEDFGIRILEPDM